jgi:hypothetical protein
MSSKFFTELFSAIDLSDPIFDSLKSDYLNFPVWFNKKQAAGAKALIFTDEYGLGAFVYLKEENEPIALSNKILKATPRLKIGTFKIAERYQGQRLGEGALGLALWKWQKTGAYSTYVTIFDRPHTQTLIGLLERFGFIRQGSMPNGEYVYAKSHHHIDYSDPYKSFPFINPAFNGSGYLIVDDVYHDTLFPYSEMKNTAQEKQERSVTNGLTKIYVGSGFKPPVYAIGDPVLIYRKYTQGNTGKGYKSCITSFCVLINFIQVKSNNNFLMTFDELIRKIGNKSVFDKDDLRKKYDTNKNVQILELLYCGFFGEGNNVNYNWLAANNYWSQPKVYPTDRALSQRDFISILTEGKANVENIILNQTPVR